jgi:hypothetical protein
MPKKCRRNADEMPSHAADSPGVEFARMKSVKPFGKCPFEWTGAMAASVEPYNA